MMCIQTIVNIAREQARIASELELTPLVPASVQTVIDWKEERRCPIPNIGSLRPKGWVRTGDEWFVDKSGFGLPSEPALTQGGFFDALAEHVSHHPDHGYAITMEGQFQLYVSAFRRRDAKRRKASRK